MPPAPPEDIMSVECPCEYCKGERRKEILIKTGKFVGGVVITTAICELAVLAAPAALAAVGFGAGGVRAASWAARVHSWIGNIQKGSIFARLTSMAMKGAMTPGAAHGMRAVIQMVHMGGVAAESLIKEDEDGNLLTPKTRAEWENVINDFIRDGHICGTCMKRIDPELRGLCASVCVC